MRIHHCGAENGLIPPNEKFKKKKNIVFMYLFAPLNMKKNIWRGSKAMT